MAYADRVEILSTLGLRQALERGTEETERGAIKSGLALIQGFPLKFRHVEYTLFSEGQVDDATLANALVSLFPNHPHRVKYIGLQDFSAKPEDQYALYCQVQRQTLAHVMGLIDGDGHALPDAREDPIFKPVKRAIGTHALSAALDIQLGHDFSKIVKDNVVAIWYRFFSAIARKDAAAVERLRVLCQMVFHILPVGIVDDLSDTLGPAWVFFVKRNDDGAPATLRKT